MCGKDASENPQEDSKNLTAVVNLILSTKSIFICFIDRVLSQVGVSFFQGESTFRTEVRRLFDLEGFAVELVEACKQRVTAFEARVAVFFDG